MHHMVFLNPRRASSRRTRLGQLGSRRLPARGTGGRFLPRRASVVRRTKAKSGTIKFIQPRNIMATRTRRRSLRRRVRRNPPKMTPAMRRKIGARIRALHRSGKYKRRSSARRSAAPVAVRRSRRSARRVTSFRRSFRRISRRSRRSGGGSIGAGMFGIKSVLSRDNLLMAGGALGATFVTNYGTALIAPRLGAMGTNPFVQAALKIAITGVTAKLASRYSRPLAQGVLIGGLLVVANDLIRRYGLPGVSAPGGTAQYLGGRRAPVSQYLGRGPAPVSPTNGTFAPAVGGVYGGGSAFKGDAWSR